MQRLLARHVPHLGRRLFLALMLAGSAVITAGSIAYFDFETLPPFVIEKLPVRFEALWLASLRIHVAAAALAFPLCLVLMTRTLQRRPVWHRWIGRITGAVVLLALVPTGIVLAFDAKGGMPVTLGFLLSAAIVACGMTYGIRTARRRDFFQHRRAMRHVVAQMSVAVTSRALMMALDAAGLDPEPSYVIALWVPVVFSALAAELVSLRPTLSVNTTGVRYSHHLLERFRREVSPLVPVLRARSVVRSASGAGR